MKRLMHLLLSLFFTVTAFAQVDIAVSKSLISPGPYQYGNNYSFNIEVFNNGNISIKDIVIRDILPCGFAYVGGTQVWTQQGNNVETTVTSTIAPGNSVMVGIDVLLLPCSQPDAWLNTVNIISFNDTNNVDVTSQDVDFSDNTDTEIMPIYDLALTKKLITPQSYTYGDVLTFEIEVFNQGNQPVNNISINDYLPIGSGYTYIPGMNAGWTGMPPLVNQVLTTQLDPGTSNSVNIKLVLNRTIGGDKIWVNYAEIGGAEDLFNASIFDADSNPGSNTFVEQDVLPGQPNDNNILGRGPAFNEDEDDHDPAGASVFDLALTKTQGSALISFSYLQEVEYVFTIFNQGSIPATNIVINDYLPDALTFMNTPKNTLRGWAYDAFNRIAKSTYTKVLLPGQSDTIKLDLQPIQWYVNPDDVWTDYAEIADADDTDPATLSKPIDLDSQTDDIWNNDAGGLALSPSDGATNGNSLGTFLSGDPVTDEDDHDPHKIQIFDLAIQNTKITPGTYFAEDEDVTFDLKVFNQGNVVAKNIIVSAYVRDGYSFITGGTNTGWNGTGPLVKYTIPQLLFPDQSTSIQITLKVKASNQPDAHYFYTEISGAMDTVNNNRNDDADSILDDDPNNDNQVLPSEVNDDNIFGNSFFGGDEDDHDVSEIIFLCKKPTLTIGIPECDPGNSTYSVIYYSNVANIMSSSGQLAGEKIIGIPIGTNVLVTANNGANCDQILTLISPDACPSTGGCSYPKLTVGQPVCGGNVYSVSFSHDMGNISTTDGQVSGNVIVNIPIGVDITVSATNGGCVSNVSVTSPTDCNIPCANSPISISGPVCEANGAGTYKINYVLEPGTSVASLIGSQGNGMFTDIPSGIDITLMVNINGCSERVIIVPSATCLVCERPTLTTGIPVCDPSNSTYTVTFYSNVANVTTNAGQINGNKITGIPLGTNATISAHNGINCIQSLTIISPSACPSTGGCTYPKLTVGQPLCGGNSYSVSFSTDMGTVITTAGQISGDAIINIPIGTDITVSATNGNCLSMVSVTSPTNCNIPCANSPISISGPICEQGNTGTYKINYIVNQGTTVTSNAGVLGNGIVTNIPQGTNAVLTITTQNCTQRIVTVPSATCSLPNGTIGKYVWHDINGNGQQDVSEPGIPGVQVTLYNPSGVQILETTTNASGLYTLSEVIPGDYYIKFSTPTGFTPTFANIGNDNSDSDLSNFFGEGTTLIFNVSPSQVISNIDAGYYRCIPIGDLVWYDINKNDVWDSNENGINGIKTVLWRNHFGTWLVWDSKFTGAKPNGGSTDGYFNFCAPPGQYYLEVQMPPLGLVRARPNIGNNEENDSDLTNSNGISTTDKFNVTSGQQKNDLGAGFYPMATAGNLVWVDENVNGIQDVGEARLPGVKVEAIDVATGNMVGSSVTDENGIYMIDYLEKQQYFLKFSPPAGYLPTIAGASTDDKDSDVDNSFGPNTTRAISMIPSVSNANVDMGVVFSVLPVEWVDITARKEGTSHKISWKVAMELNVDYYELERKLDTDQTFNTLSLKVKSKGNSFQTRQYDVSDDDTKQYGTYIYRVKQVDFDGKATYSSMVSIKNVSDNSIELYPNPAKNDIFVDVTLEQDANVSIELYDGASNFVKNVGYQTQQSTGLLTYKLDLNNLPNGVYTVLVKTGDVVTAKKLIKLE